MFTKAEVSRRVWERAVRGLESIFNRRVTDASSQLQGEECALPGSGA
jgi:hypothetical protein